MAQRLRLLLAAAFTASSAAAAPGVTGGGADGAVRREPSAAGMRAVLEAGLRAPAFRLWEQAGFGADRAEHAAWVVAAPEGLPRWRPWPFTHGDLEAHWFGPAPPGAVAIVHTHPAPVDPRPSFTDRETAVRHGVAVYTVSRTGIWKAEPDGAVTRVGDERWWAGCRPGKPCGESVSVAVAVASAETRAAAETAAGPLRTTK
jgi:hypothetical protein